MYAQQGGRKRRKVEEPNAGWSGWAAYGSWQRAIEILWWRKDGQKMSTRDWVETEKIEERLIGLAEKRETLKSFRVCVCVCVFVCVCGWLGGWNAWTHSVPSRMAADVQAAVIGARDPAGRRGSLQSPWPSHAQTCIPNPRAHLLANAYKASPICSLSFPPLSTSRSRPARLPPHLATHHISLRTRTHQHTHAPLTKNQFYHFTWVSPSDPGSALHQCRMPA